MWKNVVFTNKHWVRKPSLNAGKIFLRRYDTKRISGLLDRVYCKSISGNRQRPIPVRRDVRANSLLRVVSTLTEPNFVPATSSNCVCEVIILKTLSACTPPECTNQQISSGSVRNLCGRGRLE